MSRRFPRLASRNLSEPFGEPRDVFHRAAFFLGNKFSYGRGRPLSGPFRWLSRSHFRLSPKYSRFTLATKSLWLVRTRAKEKSSRGKTSSTGASHQPIR